MHRIVYKMAGVMMHVVSSVRELVLSEVEQILHFMSEVDYIHISYILCCEHILCSSSFCL